MNQQSLPGASNALTMGILSVVLTLLCCGPFGIIFTILGLNSASKAERLYNENPGMYTGYENVKTGRVLSYVGLALSVCYLLFLILYFGAIIAFISAGEFGNI
ncbi:CCC motif membrane protein [Muriicola sp. E247]|uniref:CCC motif membrane protein n=1 Tax=Muriicola sp. E247 TaxID=3242730 RepID=UPI0035256787